MMIKLRHCRGTEKQHVAYDYATRLHIGQVECEVSGCGYIASRHFTISYRC